jgi:phytol kinase
MMIVLIVFCGMLGSLSIYQRKCEPDAEAVRKLLHIGMGVFALSFPLLITARWQALVLCGATMLLLLAVRTMPLLQRRFGAVLGSVQRRSHGELYFVLGVTTLFCLARHSILLYAIPLLILTFADAAAALIGARFGRHRYRSIAGEKSLEGSGAFFVSAFVATFLLLVFVAALQAPFAALLALALALPLTLVEAVSWRGLDNLLLPMSAYFLLQRLLYFTTEEVSAIVLLAMMILAALLLHWREGNSDAALHSSTRHNAA